jgi:hypothetical protein
LRLKELFDSIVFPIIFKTSRENFIVPSLQIKPESTENMCGLVLKNPEIEVVFPERETSFLRT